MNWKNGLIKTKNYEMDYIVFGQGEKNLILLPGLGDGLKTVRGMALPFSALYRKTGQQYRVYSFSRRRNLQPGQTAAEMAEDVFRSAKSLGIRKAYVIGVSMGGMIGLHLAAGHPDFVAKMVLTVTTDRMESPYRDVIESWMEKALDDDYAGIMMDTAEKSYSEDHLKLMRSMYAAASHVGKPKSFDRFLILAQACIDHDATEILSKISCPTLIIGGRQDQIVGVAASYRLAEGITGSRLHIYENYGHGAYEEARDFEDRLLEFLEDSNTGQKPEADHDAMDWKAGLHPDFRPLSRLNPPLMRPAVAAAQKGMKALWAMEKTGDGVIIRHLEIPIDKKHRMKAILYSPETCRETEILPCLIYYHGGGFVFNAAPYHFHNVREYCRRAGCHVLFVDYRLAPVNPYPAAIDDAFRAYRWTQMNCQSLGIDFHRIAVGGDSAGGNLAAAVCLMARDYGAAVPCGQMLIYPAVDMRMETVSVKQFTDTPMCNSRDMLKYIRFYVPHLGSLSPAERIYASPAEAESLAGMPAAYVETAEFDCLHDEGINYARRLEEEGVSVHLYETKGTVHGYDFISSSQITKGSMKRRVQYLKNIFSQTEFDLKK